MNNKKQIILVLLIIALFQINAVGQATVANIFNTPNFTTDYLGWDVTVGFPLNIRHNGFGQPINFYTGVPQRMTILGNNGFVGIGTASPNYRLEVIEGINLSSPLISQYYMIDGERVLSNPGIANLFAGVSSGLTNSTGQFNTFLGVEAGKMNTTGMHNTFVGFSAGKLNTTGYFNTFLGICSGWNNTSGHHNTFVGHNAGQLMSTGSGNTFTGVASGQFCTTGIHNTFYGAATGWNGSSSDFNSILGYNAGNATTTGGSNTFIGCETGFNNTVGALNTYIGYRASCGAVTNLTNASAIGANAIVLEPNQMILGDPNVNVGIGLSNITPGPQSKLEINAGVANISGLQFRQLTAGSPSISFNKALSVDINGKVILVDNLTTCGSLVNNFITKNISAMQICSSRIWENSTSDYYVGIGTNLPDAKLSVFNLAPVSSKTDLAFHALIDGTNFTKETRAGFFEAFNGKEKIYAVYASALATATINTTAIHYGVYGEACAAYNTQEGFGGKFQAYHCGLATAAPVLYGIYSEVTPTSSGNYAGYFNGPLWATTYLNLPADSTLKSNIQALPSSMKLIQQLNPVSYEFKKNLNSNIALPQGVQAGFIAQELAKIFPNLVSDATHPAEYDDSGKVIHPQLKFKTVAYEGLIPFIVSALQEQQSQIDDFKSQLSVCCTKNSKIENQSHTNITQLKDIETIILDQNEPNPFAEETNISYFIPESAGKAEIMFYTNDGRLINKVEIKEKGQGTLHIYASDLSSGIYTYTLMVNGKVVETKKMMKSK